MSETRQAEYRAMSERIAYRNARVKVFSQYEALRLPLVARRGRTKVSLWGLVRPATGRTTVTIDHRAAAHVGAG